MYVQKIAKLDSHGSRVMGGIHSLAVLLLLSCVSGVFAGVPDLEGRVIGVTDGDTIKVLDAEKISHKVRLNGIDAPERKQPWGRASTEHLKGMVAGKPVWVKSVKYDRYGRLIGDVWVQPRDCPDCGKTLFVNHAMVLNGMAWWYRYYAEDQSEEDRGRFESAEREALARKRGLWSDPDPTPPWVWRRR